MSKPYVLTEKTMLTADGRAVPAGDPEGVEVLGAAGVRIPYDTAVKTGLIKPAKSAAKKTKKAKPDDSDDDGNPPAAEDGD